MAAPGLAAREAVSLDSLGFSGPVIRLPRAAIKTPAHEEGSGVFMAHRYFTDLFWSVVSSGW